MTYAQITDLQEDDELDKREALNQLLLKLQEAEKSVITEGVILAEDLEKEDWYERRQKENR